jgi:hypothetical protein
LSDDDGARRTAEERLDAYIERLGWAGVYSSGRVGDADPVQAIGRFAREVATRARKRFELPIVDTEDRLPRAA